MEDFDIELDNTWLEKLEKIEKKYDLFYKDKQESIKVYSLYVKNNEIIRTSKDTLLLDNGMLKKETLLYYLRNARKLNDTTYKIKSVTKFNITIEPEEVLSNTWQDKYFSEERNMADIYFSESISVFQDINSLFILFYFPTNKNKNTKKVYLTSRKQRKTRRRR